MRLFLIGFVLLLTFPGSAAAAGITVSLESEAGVRYGSPHEVGGKLTEGTAPLAGQTVELRGREYPYSGDFETVATTTTDAAGGYRFEQTFDRNMQLQAAAAAQGATSPVVRAYVYPRPRSLFKALANDRLRITQYLRTPENVKLSAKTIFYLGPENAKRANRVALAKPKRLGKGRFKATAVVDLPAAWKGSFRYASCFRYSEGSGLGNPGARCPTRYRF